MKKKLLSEVSYLASNSLTALNRSCSRLAFVPRHKSLENEDVDKLQEFVGDAKNLLVITGAGNSNEKLLDK